MLKVWSLHKKYTNNSNDMKHSSTVTCIHAWDGTAATGIIMSVVNLKIELRNISSVYKELPPPAEDLTVSIAVLLPMRI